MFMVIEADAQDGCRLQRRQDFFYTDPTPGIRERSE